MRRIVLSIGLIFLTSPAWASPAPTIAAPGTAPTDKPAAAPVDSPAADSAPFPGMDDLMTRAKNGEPGAEEALGNRFEKGAGVEQNYAEAAKWYRMAAEQGFTKAESELGLLYSKGQGVKLDYEEAYFWLSMSFDPFNPDQNKILDEIKSYLSQEQQEIVQNRINGWHPHKPTKKSAAVAASDQNSADDNNCPTRDVVPLLKLKLHPSTECKNAFKSMREACMAMDTTCKGCREGFENYDSVCNQDEEINPDYACNHNDDCGLVDTNCSQPYDPVSVNRQYMTRERDKNSWPMEDCGRRLEVKQQYRAVCIKLRCSVAANTDGVE